MPLLSFPFRFRSTVRSAQTLWVLLLLGSTFLASCKNNSQAKCTKACEHATNIVFDLISSKGTVTSEALEDRSEAMRLSCANECKTGELDPKCLMAADSYESLQNCSKAPEKPEEAPPADTSTPQPEP